MKNSIILLMIITIIVMIISGCESPTETSGILAEEKVSIQVHNDGKYNPIMGDTIAVRGDITVVNPQTMSLTELYANGEPTNFVPLGIWSGGSTISNFVTHAALWKDSNRISGIKYKARGTTNGVNTLNLQYDLVYGQTTQPMNMLYQAKCEPNADSLILHMGDVHGVKWNGNVFVPYGTHYESQRSQITAYWTGHADSTSNANHTGLIHNPVSNMDETIGPGMNIYLAWSGNDMDKAKMEYSTEYGGCYKLTFWVLNTIPTSTILQDLYVVELPNWSIKRYGINVVGPGGATELIFVRDFDPGPSVWPIFTLRMSGPNGNRPINEQFYDTRSDFVFTDIIPH